MSETTIEYAVFTTEGDEAELQVATGTDRERAFRIAAMWNRKVPGIATVYDRKVETSDWKVANTGVVPPMRGGIEE
jgi:hypothetical protein